MVVGLRDLGDGGIVSRGEAGHEPLAPGVGCFKLSVDFRQPRLERPQGLIAVDGRRSAAGLLNAQEPLGLAAPGFALGREPLDPIALAGQGFAFEPRAVPSVGVRLGGAEPLVLGLELLDLSAQALVLAIEPIDVAGQVVDPVDQSHPLCIELVAG